MNWIVPLGSACDTTEDITEKKKKKREIDLILPVCFQNSS